MEIGETRVGNAEWKRTIATRKETSLVATRRNIENQDIDKLDVSKFDNFTLLPSLNTHLIFASDVKLLCTN